MLQPQKHLAWPHTRQLRHSLLAAEARRSRPKAHAFAPSAQSSRVGYFAFLLFPLLPQEEWLILYTRSWLVS